MHSVCRLMLLSCCTLAACQRFDLHCCVCRPQPGSLSGLWVQLVYNERVVPQPLCDSALECPAERFLELLDNPKTAACTKVLCQY